MIMNEIPPKIQTTYNDVKDVGVQTQPQIVSPPCKLSDIEDPDQIKQLLKQLLKEHDETYKWSLVIQTKLVDVKKRVKKEIEKLELALANGKKKLAEAEKNVAEVGETLKQAKDACTGLTE